MRRLALPLLLLASCGRQSPDSLYRTARNQLDHGEAKAALETAEAGLRRDASWRFRLLKAEALLANADPKEALALLDLAAPQNAEDRARLAMYRAQAKYMSGDFAGAERDLNASRAVAAPLHAPLLDAQIELRHGALLTQTGHSDLAIESYRTVFRQATQLGDLYLQAAALGNLGVQLHLTHHPDQAIYWLERARDVSERLGSAYSVAKAIGNLGSCYQDLGDSERALAYLNDAIARFEKLGNKFELQAWIGSVGNVLLDTGDYREAAAKFSQALPMSRPYGEGWTGTWLINLAIASIELKDFAAAERYNNEALGLQQSLSPEFKGYMEINRARILAGRNDLAAAEKLLRSIIDQSSSDPAEPISAESYLAELLVARRDRAGADAQFRSAQALIEHQQSTLARDEYKLSYFSSLIRLYQDYVDFLVANGQTAKALEIVESSRARVLDEKLNSNGRSERSISVAALQQIAQSSNSVLLSYWLAPARSFLWVISAQGVAIHELPPEKKIAALVESYGSLVENLRDPVQAESPAGRELAETLLGPIAPLLHENGRIILVPDRALHSLNFETLPDPANPSRYVVERTTISVAPSLGMLANPRRAAAAADKSILLIGDPDPAVDEFPRLPFAEKEIALIEQNFSPQSSLVMQGPRANPAAYRDNDPARFRFIHFAAHASANRESPLDSALILSRNQSGYALSARDVMNVPLHAELVTLSACRSAGARMYSGEGLVGLSWAFLRAGANNVVAGLWDVNDLSTANLMADFYSQLARGASPAAALREAKLRMLHSSGANRKPFYWGPFQLYVGSNP